MTRLYHYIGALMVSMARLEAALVESMFQLGNFMIWDNISTGRDIEQKLEKRLKAWHDLHKQVSANDADHMKRVAALREKIRLLSAIRNHVAHGVFSVLNIDSGLLRFVVYKYDESRKPERYTVRVEHEYTFEEIRKSWKDAVSYRQEVVELVPSARKIQRQRPPRRGKA